MDHQDIDKRSLEMHRMVCDMIRENPALLEKAWSNIAKKIQRCGYDSHEGWYIREWEKILSMPLEDCLKTVLDETEYGNQIRQATPFAGIIPQDVRHDFLKEWFRKIRSRDAERERELRDKQGD